MVKHSAVRSSEPIRVALVADGNYAMPLSVAVCSTAIHCDANRALHFSIFCVDFPDNLKEMVEKSLQGTGHAAARIDWREIDVSSLSDLPVMSYLNVMTYGRLLIPDLLPPAVSKFLYLDADVVVVDDISELWSQDVQCFSLLAARDRIGTVGNPGGLRNYRDLGLPSDAKYFNAGVLLVNASRWRDKDVGRRVLRYLRLNKEVIQMGDQEGLNAVLHDDWAELDFRWNWQVIPSRRRAIEAGCWGLELDEKSVVHFVTSQKPWHPDCRYDERRLFFQYVDHTEWAGWRIPRRQECVARLKRIARQVVRR